MKKHMDDMLKNECFLDKESSIYAGLMLGAIYSTLIKKIPEVIPPGFSYGCLLDTYNLLANGIIAYTVVEIKYALIKSRRKTTLVICQKWVLFEKEIQHLCGFDARCYL